MVAILYMACSLSRIGTPRRHRSGLRREVSCPGHTPVDEHTWSDHLHLAQPLTTAPLILRQGLVLAPGPPLKSVINVVKQFEHRALIERPIVVPPSLYDRVALLCQIIQRR